MPLVIYDFFFMKEGFVQSLEIEIEDLEPRAEDCTRLIQNPQNSENKLRRKKKVVVLGGTTTTFCLGIFFCIESMDMEK